ncbi:MAG: EamA family transporter, partial [Alphaproteobacteria bacterium]|nr:EamA family transporter [Alphaproteobacteria bacterium]
MTRRALLLLAVLALVWGATWPIMKVAVLGLEPWTFRTYCGVLGGIGMLCVARMNGHRLMMAPDQLRLAVLIAPFSLGGWFVFSALGVGLMGSGRAAI